MYKKYAQRPTLSLSDFDLFSELEETELKKYFDHIVMDECPKVTQSIHVHTVYEIQYGFCIVRYVFTTDNNNNENKVCCLGVFTLTTHRSECENKNKLCIISIYTYPMCHYKTM